MSDTLRKLVSMEYDDEDKHDSLATAPMPMPEQPDYPYGLRITLSEKELAKLELDPDEAESGASFTGVFRARITSVSKEERDGKKTCRIEAQIEKLAVDADNELPGEKDRGQRRRSMLYDRKKEADDGDESE